MQALQDGKMVNVVDKKRCVLCGRPFTLVPPSAKNGKGCVVCVDQQKLEVPKTKPGPKKKVLKKKVVQE